MDPVGFRGSGPLFDRVHSTGSARRDGSEASLAGGNGGGYNEVNSYIESQQRRIQELERINIDLERRLEQQARERMKLERESAENKRAWEAQHADIGRERDEWKGRYEKELLHIQKLRENNRRLERELHGFLQKKYDFMQIQSRSASLSAGGGGGNGGGGGGGAGALGAGGPGGGGGGGVGAKGGPPLSSGREGDSQGGTRGMMRSATLGSSSGRGGERGGGGGGGGGGGERGGMGGEAVPLNPKDLTPETVREKRVIQTMCDFFGF